MSQSRTAYPAERETDAVLRDGTAIRIRPIRPDDGPRLTAFFLALSPESRALRFFGATSDDAIAAYACRAVEVDYARNFGLVAVAGTDERIVGHAAYNAGTHDAAEASFAIADGYQGRGLGTILLGHLCEIAAGHGIGVFEALVLPHNDQMVAVFREAGFPINVRFTGSELSVTFPTALTQEALDRFYHRDQIAAEHARLTGTLSRGVILQGHHCLTLLHDEHGDVGRVQHALAHAPQDQAADLAPTPAPHDDHVRPRLAGGVDDLRGRVAFAVGGGDGDAGPVKLPLRVLERFPPRILQPLLDDVKVDHGIRRRSPDRERRNVSDSNQQHLTFGEFKRDARGH